MYIPEAIIISHYSIPDPQNLRYNSAMDRSRTPRSAGKMVIILVVPTLILLLDAVSIAQATASTKSNKLDKKDAAGGGGGRPSLTTYDQRQTGKYNIHVNIKDVKIISVDGEKFEGEFGVRRIICGDQ